MSQSSYAEWLVIHIAGQDQPGITSRLLEIIAQEKAQLINIGQSVVNGYLALSAVVDIPQQSYALRRILIDFSRLGLRTDVSTFASVDDGQRAAQEKSLCVTILGELGDGAAISGVTKFLAERKMNIRGIETLSDRELKGLELIVDLPEGRKFSTDEREKLRAELLTLSCSLKVDIGVQLDDIFRRNKRLVCMDVDSTFITAEVIDELAKLVGKGEQVAKVTERAMRGELDFSQALRERVSVLKGLTLSKARELTDQIKVTSGAPEFCQRLKSLGFRIGLVSGGFTFLVDELKQKFGLDFAFANELEIVDGVLTGGVRGTIVDGQRKAQLLKDMAQVYQCRLEQTVAIGDGANDIMMLQTAGLGIAFHGKPKLQQVADLSLNHHHRLDTLLFLMGFSAEDLHELT